jgi:hypothetical protein
VRLRLACRLWPLSGPKEKPGGGGGRGRGTNAHRKVLVRVQEQAQEQEPVLGALFWCEGALCGTGPPWDILVEGPPLGGPGERWGAVFCAEDAVSCVFQFCGRRVSG